MEEKPKIVEKEAKRIRNRCGMRMARRAERMGVTLSSLRKEYEKCVQSERDLFLAGKKPKKRKQYSEQEIEEYRRKMAEEKEGSSDPWSDPNFVEEMIGNSRHIHSLEHPEIAERRKRENKKEKEKIEKDLRDQYGYGED